jgi:VanZ family protein
MGTIFFLSHKTGEEVTLPEIAGIDLAAHFTIYALLACAVLFAWTDNFKRMYPLKTIVYTVLFCFLYGISDEFHQSFIPGRFVSLLDVVADTVGPVLVCSLWWLRGKKLIVSKTLS